jgi:hypothetical protein
LLESSSGQTRSSIGRCREGDSVHFPEHARHRSATAI